MGLTNIRYSRKKIQFSGGLEKAKNSVNSYLDKITIYGIFYMKLRKKK